MTDFVKLALFVAAGERMRAGSYGISPRPTEPRINRRHIDGPYLSTLDGQIRWLTLWERLLTKVGFWDAWDIEWRRFPLPALAAATGTAKTAQRVECEASQSGGEAVTHNLSSKGITSYER